MTKHTLIRGWLKNSSLSREYFIFASIVVFSAIAASIAIGCQIYSSHIIKTRQTLSVDAGRINVALTNTFSEATQMMVYVGKQIAKNGGQDLYFIENLIRNTDTEYKSSHLFSWSRFDWVAPNNLQLVNRMTGIAVTPPDMSIREYTWKSPKSPWTLQVSRPAIGNPSKLWVIPAGVGITNRHGKYIGALVVGFNIAELTARIDQAVPGNTTSFLVLDNNYRIVTHSADIDIAKDSDYYHDLLKDKNLFTAHDQDFLEPFEDNGTLYYHYQKMGDYPYVILTGINKKILNHELYSLLFPRITEFLFVGIFGLVLLYFFRRKIINPITTLSDAASHISKGNTSIKITNQNSLEMHNLARGLLKVKWYIKKLDNYKKRLESKNQELQETKERLEYTANLVQESDDAKEEFVRRINEEMDIPLQAIIAYSDVLARHVDGQINVSITKEKHVSLLNQISESAQDLRMMTTRILDIREIDVPTVINQCVTIHTREAMLKSIHLETRIEMTMPQFYADELRFKQIILGLVSRSIEYSPFGRTIIVSVNTVTEEDVPFLRLTVSDNGFGLTEKDIERIDTTFGKGGINRKAIGTDLELPAIKKLIRMHKGQFRIASKLGEGTSITVLFPYMTEEELGKVATEGRAGGNIVPLFND